MSIFSLARYLSSSVKIRIYFVLLFSIVAAIVELTMVAVIIPFISLLIEPSINTSSGGQFLEFMTDYITFESKISGMATIFIIVVILSGVFRFILVWQQAALIKFIGIELSQKVYAKIMHQNYEFYLNTNSGDLLSSITNRLQLVIDNVIMQFIFMISSFIIVVILILGMIYINPLTTLLAISLITCIYYLIIRVSKKTVQKSSKILNSSHEKIIRNLQEGFGSIRDLIIDNSFKRFYEEFYKNVNFLRKSQETIHILGMGPRYVIESLLLVLIAISAVLFSQQSGGGSILPVLGGLALMAQRSMPLVQQIYSSITYIRSSSHAFDKIISLLSMSVVNHKTSTDLVNIPFNDSIKLENVWFKYKDSKDWILKNVNFEIKKGDFISIVGKTGSGKSTLIDIIMGLVKPTKGSVLIDGKELSIFGVQSWQKNLAHVSQSVYLIDGSILDNICLSNNGKIEDNFALNAAKQAELIVETDDINTGLSLNTLVGEEGVRISGGQKQRVGISRALFKKSNVLVLDEATSALDKSTANKIIRNLSNKGLTILMITHEEEIRKLCNYSLEVKNHTVKINYDN